MFFECAQIYTCKFPFPQPGNEPFFRHSPRVVVIVAGPDSNRTTSAHVLALFLPESDVRIARTEQHKFPKATTILEA